MEHWSLLAAFVLLVGVRELVARLLSTPEKFYLPNADAPPEDVSINTAALKRASVIIWRKPNGGLKLRLFMMLPALPPAVGAVLGVIPGMPAPPWVSSAVEGGMIWAPSLVFGAVGVLSTWFTSRQVVRRFLKSK